MGNHPTDIQNVQNFIIPNRKGRKGKKWVVYGGLSSTSSRIKTKSLKKKTEEKPLTIKTYQENES